MMKSTPDKVEKGPDPAREEPPLAVGLGELLWDELPSGRRLGGAPANFAGFISASGGRGVIVSSVGEDTAGREIREALRRCRIEDAYIANDRSHPTGRVSVEINREGIPRYVIHTGTAWDYIPWDDRFCELAGRADAVCFGTLAQRAPLTRNTVRMFLEETGEKCLRVFDINLRQSYYTEDIISAGLENAGILKLNLDELEVVSRIFAVTGSIRARVESIHRRWSLDIIALTRGADGSLLFDGERFSDQAGKKVDIKDTVGAGDAFTAALVMGRLRDRTLEEIHRGAESLAASVCTRSGAGFCEDLQARGSTSSY